MKSSEEIGELCTYSDRFLKLQIPRRSSDWTTVTVWLENNEIVEKLNDSPVRLEVRNEDVIPNSVQAALDSHNLSLAGLRHSLL